MCTCAPAGHCSLCARWSFAIKALSIEYHICTFLLSCTIMRKSSVHMALWLFFTYNIIGVVIRSMERYDLHVVIIKLMALESNYWFYLWVHPISTVVILDCQTTVKVQQKLKTRLIVMLETDQYCNWLVLQHRLVLHWIISTRVVRYFTIPSHLLTYLSTLTKHIETKPIIQIQWEADGWPGIFQSRHGS